MSDKDNIPSSGAFDDPASGQLSEEKLMAYLEGKLSPGEQHQVEEWLGREGMESDALEGLRSLNPGETKQIVNRLNYKLRKTILHKRKRKKIKTKLITIIAVAIILLLATVAYFIISKAVRR